MLRCCFFVIALAVGAGWVVGADESFRKQVEADWLRQEAVRAENARPTGSAVTPEKDATGGCDGVKNGKWGFHTENQASPWWQVDLGKPASIRRIVLFNRCDATAGRNARLMILVSDDGQAFRQVFQNDGKVFYGFTDKKPLVVELKDVLARYVRLQLPGKSYFHLDEVEIYGPDGANLALNRPATQSSVSMWSVDHGRAEAVVAFNAVAVVERGLKVAADLEKQCVDVSREMEELRQIGRCNAQSPEDMKKAYLDARWAVRRLALKNPLLDFDAILFTKAAAPLFPHMSDQFYGWWSRPGGGVCVLENFKSDQPRARCLTADMAAGCFIRPELSFDGKKVLFAYCRHHPELADVKDKATKANVPEDAFYHLFEMNVDGTGRRQLTRGRYDDFDGRYLPNGDIVFLSTRKGQFLQTTAASAAATLDADLPDSYVRCGGDNYRPVPVFTMHAMSGDGRNVRPISAFENFEWTPALAHDGRVLYTRWDYIDRFNGHFFSLWSTNPDGTNASLVYGNYTVRPQVVCEARPVPGSHKLVFTASAHHSIIGGSLVLFDRTRGLEGDAPLTRLTPEVPYPETEANVGSYYANPWPLSEQHFLTAWSDRRLPPHCRVDDTDRNPANATGIYLFDAFGNLNLLHRDPEISSGCPIPIKPRETPAAWPVEIADSVRQEGAFLVQDVYQGLTGVERGSVKQIRVIGVPPKTQPHMNRPNIGVSHEDPAKYLLGTVPVEPDGSAYFRAPSGIPVMFQAVAADGMAIQTMRSLTYVTPGQTASCVGCHESREAAPLPTGSFPLAARREPSKLELGPSGTWPLEFSDLVQPVLDRHCVSCHRPGAKDQKAAAFDLTAEKSYDHLLSYADKDLWKLVHEKDRSEVGDCAARKSKLLTLLKAEAGHEGVRLDAGSVNRLVLWMDIYAHRQGHYSAEQAEKLAELKRQLSPILAP